jgi:hypothetical protein
MRMTMTDLANRAARALRGVADADDIGWACAWLEACGYPGVKLLAEALADEVKDVALERDAIGFDLAQVSCAFLAPRILRDVEANGRVFLRNVRHGLYLLPFTVRGNIAIGCPVDPAFAVGGERHKNPYADKLALVEANGFHIDDVDWMAL